MARALATRLAALERQAQRYTPASTDEASVDADVWFHLLMLCYTSDGATEEMVQWFREHATTDGRPPTDDEAANLAAWVTELFQEARRVVRDFGTEAAEAAMRQVFPHFTAQRIQLAVGGRAGATRPAPAGQRSHHERSVGGSHRCP